MVSYLISKHRYGGPMPKDNVVNRSGLRKDQLGEAKEGFEELRKHAPFVEDHDNRGIKLDNNCFGLLADFLYDSCEGWDVDKINTRLKHYEGWKRHEWYPPDR